MKLLCHKHIQRKPLGFPTATAAPSSCPTGLHAKALRGMQSVAFRWEEIPLQCSAASLDLLCSGSSGGRSLPACLSSCFALPGLVERVGCLSGQITFSWDLRRSLLLPRLVGQEGTSVPQTSSLGDSLSLPQQSTLIRKQDLVFL